MSEAILVKITGLDKKKGEFLCQYGSRSIRVDPFVGNNLPSSFFDLLNMENITDREYCFEGDWFSQDGDIFLSSAMYDPIDD